MLLDDRFLAVAQRWPRLMSRVLRESASQLARFSDDLAISQLPRVEDRLLAMFWTLADRWGARSGNDVRVRLAVTHGTLGRLIGARRPTVSLGLRSLAETGALRREGDDWLMPITSLDGFGPVAAMPVQRPAAPRPRVPQSAEPASLIARSAALRAEIASGRARRAATIAEARRLRLTLRGDLEATA